MDLSIGDQYYLKAKDYYPYNLEFVVENLNYALSYDDEHAPANCLQGLIYMYHLKDYQKALASFTVALQGDLNYIDTYKHASLLNIWLGNYEQAQKLIQYGLRVRGMDATILLSHQAYIHEYKGEFKQAKTILKKVKTLSINPYMIHKIEADLKRIKTKSKAFKSKSKNRIVRLAV